MDLDSLKQELSDEIRRLDQRQAALKDQMAHLQAVEQQSLVLDGDSGMEAKPLLSRPKRPLPDHKVTEQGDPAVSALRCLKCGSSLSQLVPKDSSGTALLNSPRLGHSDGGSRYLQCPQCMAKNMFVRTTSPVGWRLLVTQLKQ